jgi:capsular exopolysaccharide synthesis family protein
MEAESDSSRVDEAAGLRALQDGAVERTAPGTWPPTETPRRSASDYLRILRRRWLLIASQTLVVVGVALGLSLTGTKKYDAIAKVLLRQNDPSNQLLAPGSAAPGDPERDLNTQVGLIKLQGIADEVSRRIGLGVRSHELLDKIDVRIENNSDIAALTVGDTSPRRAARIANAFADEYVDFRQRSARATLDEAARLARARLLSLTPAERASTLGRELKGRLRELEIAAAVQTGGAAVVLRASPPSSAAAPHPLRNGLLGLALGLILASAAALALESANRRLTDEEDAQGVLGLPVLASIPRPRPNAGTDVATKEAYGRLAANLRFSDLNDELAVIMVTSPGREEGKTSVTLGLAVALAAIGQRVIAIEAELRTPRFAEHLNLEPRGGLSSVLAGFADLDDELVELDPDTLDAPKELGSDLGGALFVLPAAFAVPNPAGALSSPEMAQAVAQARAQADVVVIDTPPIAVVHDAITLSNLVDGAILVACLNRTTKDAARRALKSLRHLNVRIPGLVITGSESSSDRYGPTAPASFVVRDYG